MTVIAHATLALHVFVKVVQMNCYLLARYTQVTSTWFSEKNSNDAVKNCKILTSSITSAY